MTTRTIVLIEDDLDLFSLLNYNLQREGFGFYGLRAGKGAVDLCRKVRPDLILLDIILSDLDGLDICREIRRDPDLASVPIIFVTALASESDRILGLEAGANDYIEKPFSVRELIARIRLHTREEAQAERVLRIGGVELDSLRCRVRVNGSALALTVTEFRLLEFLMRRPGVVFSREQLLQEVWSHDRAITDRAVDVFVGRLRRKLERDPANPLLIGSVRGFGYTFLPSSGEPNRAASASSC